MIRVSHWTSLQYGKGYKTSKPIESQLQFQILTYFYLAYIFFLLSVAMVVVPGSSRHHWPHVTSEDARPSNFADLLNLLCGN